MPMTMDSRAVGREFAGLDREVTWREITNYAVAVGDTNPRYMDDSRQGGIVAPPMFASALTWPVMHQFNHRLGGAVPPQVLPTLVHASEHLVFHRPIRPGDHLRVGGEAVGVFPGKSGTWLVMRLEAHDFSGGPVFTEYVGGVFRGVQLSDGGAGEGVAPGWPHFDEPETPGWSAELAISRQQPYLYDGCTDIVFPIHTSVSFARAMGLPDVVLQGTCTLAMAAREVLDREGGGTTERLRELACDFRAMVVPDSTIRVELTHRERRGVETLVGFRVLAGDGDAAIRHGFARISD